MSGPVCSCGTLPYSKYAPYHSYLLVRDRNDSLSTLGAIGGCQRFGSSIGKVLLPDYAEENTTGVMTMMFDVALVPEEPPPCFQFCLSAAFGTNSAID